MALPILFGSMLALAVFVFLVPLCLQKWQTWRVQMWVREQLDVANFHYAPTLQDDLQARLLLRAKENHRLKVAFGIHNSLTTTSPSVHQAFLKTASRVLNRRGRDWEVLYGIAKAFLEAEIETAAKRSLPLAESIRCMVLAVVLFDSFGIDTTTIPRSDLATITAEINRQWLRSKSHRTDVTPSERLNSAIASLNITSSTQGAEQTALLPTEVLGLLMPQYETLWRVVLLTFVTAYHHQPAAYPDTVQRTTNVPSCLGDPAREKEALKLAKEGLRLYPSNKHLYRAGVPTATTTVAVDLAGLHRHVHIWGRDAARFRPARFDAAKLTAAQRQAYVPFSVKPHKCPAAGGAFGERMVVVLVTALGRVLGPGRGVVRFGGGGVGGSAGGAGMWELPTGRGEMEGWVWEW